jgi:predicted Zn-dependent peptidase
MLRRHYSYADYIDGIEKSRANNKLDKNTILYRALMSYATYGPKSGFTDILSSEQMRQINPEELTAQIKKITTYPHRVFYYGQKTKDDALALVKAQHSLPSQLDTIPTPVRYNALAIDKPVVYFVDYDMVQTMLIMLSKDENLNVSLIPYITFFNEFYGAGLSSIVFQEIRESKGLAYSAYSYFNVPDKPYKAYYNQSFVATQADKLMQATEAMKKLLSEIPSADNQFAATKDALQKQIESERIIKQDVF